MNIVIKNGRIIDIANKLDSVMDIAIENGKIKHLGDIPAGFAAHKTIDAKDCFVLPGLIDNCCRPQMQHPHGTTLFDEAQAALKRGFTSLCIPPDGDPIVIAVDGALPSGATFTQNLLQWTPDFNQAGAYRVSFRV